MVLLLTLAGIMGLMLTATQSDVLDVFSSSSSAASDTVDEQQSGLVAKIEEGMRRGIERGGIAAILGGEGGDSTGSSGTSSSSNSGAATESTTQAGCVGGGDCYENKICSTPSGAQTVSSASELESAVSSASSGDTVYIDGSAEIGLGGTTLEPGEGVTIASNRGCNGAEGALLSSDSSGARMIVSDADNVRVTGLRVSGPFGDQKGTNSLYDGDGWDVGIRLNGESAVVDNNEVFGFRHAGVDVGGSEAVVHHNMIHYNAGNGLGYGIVSSTGAEPIPVFEYNYFNYNRHAVVTHASNSYRAQYNIYGPEMPNHHVFDAHGTEDTCGQHCGGTASGTIIIQQNTIEATTDYAVSIRGVPAEEGQVTDNWFYHDSVEDAVRQQKSTNWENLEVSNNHYGESEPSSCDIGAPREGCQ
jgi:hypothetical protein